MCVHHIHACLVLQRSEGVASPVPEVADESMWVLGLKPSVQLTGLGVSSQPLVGKEWHEFQDSLGYLVRLGRSNNNREERGQLLTHKYLKTKQNKNSCPELLMLWQTTITFVLEVEEITLLQEVSP